MVIGIDQYEHWPKLNNAVRDATEVNRVLQEHFGFTGVPLTLVDQQATKAAVESLVKDWLRSDLDPMDELIFFFAGHGTTRIDQLGTDRIKTGYLVPVEAAGESEKRWSGYIEIVPLLEDIAKLPAQRILVILDSCHSGFAIGSSLLTYRGESRYQDDLTGRISRKVITSARHDQLAADGGAGRGHSLFTALLLDGLQNGWADLDGDGRVSSSELGLYLQQQVGKQTNSRQTPEFGGFKFDQGGELFLHKSLARPEWKPGRPSFGTKVAGVPEDQILPRLHTGDADMELSRIARQWLRADERLPEIRGDQGEQASTPQDDALGDREHMTDQGIDGLRRRWDVLRARLAGRLEVELAGTAAQSMRAGMSEPLEPAQRHDRGIGRLLSGDIQAALQDLNEAIQSQPEQAQYYFSRGVAYQILGLAQEAIADLSQAIALEPERSGAYRERAIAHRLAGDARQSIADCDSALQRNPTCAESFWQRGLAWESLREFDRAFHDFEQAMRASSDDVRPKLGRGLLFMRSGVFDKAVEDYSGAIQLDQASAEAYNNRGVANEFRNDLDALKLEDAIRDFNQAIQLDPQFAAAYYERGQIGLESRSVDHLAQNVRDLDKVIELKPYFLSAYYQRGIAHERRGAMKAAIADFSKLAVLQPNKAAVRDALARCTDGAADRASVAAQVVASIEAGRYHAALTTAEQHLKAQREAYGEDHPETLAAANLVGLAHLGEGDAAQARALFEHVLQGYQKVHRERHVLTAEARNNLGVALFHEGRWPQACQVLQEAYVMRKSLLGEPHVDTIQSLANLAAAQRWCGLDVPAEYLQWIDKQLFAEDEDWVESDPEDDAGVEEPEFAWEDEFHGNPLRAFWDDQEARSIGPAATSADLFEIWENELPAPQLILIGAVADARMIEIADDQRTLATVRVLERVGQIVPADHAVWLVPWETIAEIKAEHYGPKHLQTLLAEHNTIASQELGYEAGGHLGMALEPDDWIDEPLQEASPESRVERFLAAVEAVVGCEHRLTASMHQNLGIALSRETSRNAQSRQHLETAFQILESRLGASHPRTAAAAELLGLAAYYAKAYPEAIEHLERATEIRRKIVGNEHVLAAQSLNSLGIARYQLAQFEAARECIQQALDIRAAMRGPLDPLTLRSLNDLAVVLKALGDYAAAVRYLELAVERLTEWEQAQLDISEDPFDVAGHLRIMDREVLENNLAVLRFEMGDYDAARRHLEAILRDEPDGWLADEALLNLGSLARLEGRLDEARELFQRRASRDAFCLLTQHNLGAIARDAGDLQTAAKYLDRVLEQRLERFGDQHPDVAFSLVAAALLDQRRGDYHAAENRLEAALEIYSAVYGPGNPRTTDVLRMAGENDLLAGRPTEAVARLDRALENKLRLADDLLPALTEAEAIAYVLAHRERDLLLTALAGSDDSERAYEVVWKTRALATQTIAARQKIPRQDNAAQVAAELQNVRRELAGQMLTHYLHDADEEAPPYRDETLLELQQRKERLERRFAELSPSDHRQRELQGVDSRQFIEALPADVAVVEIVRVKRPGAAAGGPAQTAASDYHAFVLLPRPSTARSPVAWIDLGDSQPIDDAVTAWLRQIGQHQGAVRGPLWTPEPLPARDPQAANAEPNITLRRRVWDKVQPHLAGRKTVVMIPDGVLVRVPWAALPGEKPGTYLIEDGFSVATATYPRQILDLLQAEPPSGNRHLLVGGVDYDDASGEPITEKTLAQYAMTTRGTLGRVNRHWERLPGTRAEVQSVQQLLPAEEPYVLLTESAASRAAVIEALPSSRYVLLATHGFFAPAEYVSALDTTNRRGPADPQMLTTVQGLFPRSTLRPSVLTSIAGRNPLTLSGIVLAGANREPAPNAMGALGDDGILTAEEIAGLRLDATELVVLSACASGLGELVGGEGVFGLQRAFALAGTRTVVASLWHVEDDATRALMTEFYRQWWQNRRGKLEALAHAQRTMLRCYDPQTKQLRQPDQVSENAAEPPPLSPFYWSAFSLSGDWR